MKFGLLPTPKDDRDFKLGAITTLPKLSELPTRFILSGFNIKDQKDTDYCSAFMSCAMSEFQERVELSPEWSFAKSKEISGDIAEFGQDLRTALKVHTKHGAIEQSRAPYSLKNKDDAFLRDIANWPSELNREAPKHIKKSYISVTGPYDHFDNIRATIWKYRKEKRAVGTGVLFGWDIRNEYFNIIPKQGTGHAMPIIGWTSYGLIYLNSFGRKAGDDGVHYVSREVVNRFVEEYNAFMFIDMAPADVKYMLDNGITDKDSLVVEMLKVVLTLLKQLYVIKR